MSYLKCPSCQGQKTTIGLGMLHHKCKECDGIGYVGSEEVDPKHIDNKVLDFQEAPKVQKMRRGRPKKSQF